MADRVVITDPNTIVLVEKYAKQMDISPADAAVHLIGVAKSRINALRKYAAKKAEGKPAPKKAEPKKAEKKAEPKLVVKRGPVKAKAPKVKKAEPKPENAPATGFASQATPTT